MERSRQRLFYLTGLPPSICGSAGPLIEVETRVRSSRGIRTRVVAGMATETQRRSTMFNAAIIFRARRPRAVADCLSLALIADAAARLLVRPSALGGSTGERI